jgi:hypothetical protein
MGIAGVAELCPTRSNLFACKMKQAHGFQAPSGNGRRHNLAGVSGLYVLEASCARPYQVHDLDRNHPGQLWSAYRTSQLEYRTSPTEKGWQLASGSQSQPMAQDIVDMYDATDGSLVIKHHE